MCRADASHIYCDFLFPGSKSEATKLNEPTALQNSDVFLCLMVFDKNEKDELINVPGRRLSQLL